MSSPRPPEAVPAAVFAALGDATRLSLLSRLSEGEASSISALSADTRLTRQAVTKHLHALEQAGLVRSERIGRESRFAFRPGSLGEVEAYLHRVSAQWDAAISRLRNLVER